MNIREEKKYLYGVMSDLVSERRTLTEEILTIRKRIDELSKLEETTLKDIDLQTYMKMHEEFEETRKKRNMEKLLPSPKNETITEARGFTPIEEPKPLTQNQMMEIGIKKMIEEGGNSVILEQPSIETKIEKVPSKPYKEFKEETEKLKRPRKRENRKHQYEYIRMLLKESKTAISKKELKKSIEEYFNIELKEHHITDMIKHLMKIDKNFQHAGTRGYYTYRGE